MNFNDHSRLKGQHAFLSPSNSYWLRYDEEKLISSYRNAQAKTWGTRLHSFAAEAIELGIKLPRTKQTLNQYVNDAIGFMMTPEQVLWYSDVCFGTADAIAFDEKKKLLRIHDLKTGVTPASMDQLLVYEALFCLEYGMNPSKFDAELRIYQNDEIDILSPGPDDVMPVIDKIIDSDRILQKLREEI